MKHSYSCRVSEEYVPNKRAVNAGLFLHECDHVLVEGDKLVWNGTRYRVLYATLEGPSAGWIGPGGEYPSSNPLAVVEPA